MTFALSRWSGTEPEIYVCIHIHVCVFADGSVVKNQPANARDEGLIPQSGRYPGGGNGNPLQCSCLENPRDGGAWWAAVSGVAQSRTRLKRLSSSSSSSSSRILSGVSLPLPILKGFFCIIAFSFLKPHPPTSFPRVIMLQEICQRKTQQEAFIVTISLFTHYFI